MHKNPRVGSREYHANHQEVRRLRGRAVEHVCVHCPASAEHWATVRNTDASDPYDHYIPLCVQCHWSYDNAERRARMSAAAKGRNVSPETRAKLSAAAKGRAQSAQERRSKSESLKQYWAMRRAHTESAVPRDVTGEISLSDCLTPAKAGALLGVDTRVLWRWANAGKIPFVRTRRGYRRYPQTAVETLLAQRGTK